MNPAHQPNLPSSPEEGSQVSIVEMKPISPQLAARTYANGQHEPATYVAAQEGVKRSRTLDQLPEKIHSEPVLHRAADRGTTEQFTPACSSGDLTIEMSNGKLDRCSTAVSIVPEVRYSFAEYTLL